MNHGKEMNEARRAAILRRWRAGDREPAVIAAAVGCSSTTASRVLAQEPLREIQPARVDLRPRRTLSNALAKHRRQP